MERCVRLRTFARYYGDIARKSRHVFARDFAFLRQNSLKLHVNFARNSFSRFEGVKQGHSPGLA